MSKIDFAYLAGFFDGEGCIQITGDKYVLHCGITNTNKWVLELFRFNFSGSVAKKQTYQPNQQPLFRWFCSSTTARVFLETLLPYLKIKRAQAEVAIKFQLRKEKAHYVHSVHPVPESERILREAERVILRKLKREAEVNIDNLRLASNEKDNQIRLF